METWSHSKVVLFFKKRFTRAKVPEDPGDPIRIVITFNINFERGLIITARKRGWCYGWRTREFISERSFYRFTKVTSDVKLTFASIIVYGNKAKDRILFFSRHRRMTQRRNFLDVVELHCTSETIQESIFQAEVMFLRCCICDLWFLIIPFRGCWLVQLLACAL